MICMPHRHTRGIEPFDNKVVAGGQLNYRAIISVRSSHPSFALHYIMEPGAPPVVANLAVASTANKGAVEQQIDPWSVSAAIDDQGNTLAFDYEAISRYLTLMRSGIAAIEHLTELLARQKVEHFTHRRGPSGSLRTPYWTQTSPMVAPRPLLQSPRLRPHPRLL